MVRAMRWVIAIALCVILVLWARSGAALGAWSAEALAPRHAPGAEPRVYAVSAELGDFASRLRYPLEN